MALGKVQETREHGSHAGVRGIDADGGVQIVVPDVAAFEGVGIEVVFDGDAIDEDADGAGGHGGVRGRFGLGMARDMNGDFAHARGWIDGIRENAERVQRDASGVDIDEIAVAGDGMDFGTDAVERGVGVCRLRSAEPGGADGLSKKAKRRHGRTQKDSDRETHIFEDTYTVTLVGRRCGGGSDCWSVVSLRP